MYCIVPAEPVLCVPWSLVLDLAFDLSNHLDDVQNAKYVPFFLSRYEVNPEKIDEIESAGLEFVGKDETGMRMEIVELPRECCVCVP